MLYMKIMKLFIKNSPHWTFKKKQVKKLLSQFTKFSQIELIVDAWLNYGWEGWE